MTLVGSVGRWHGSLAKANLATLEHELRQEAIAIARIRGVIAENRRLLAIHQAQTRGLKTRINRAKAANK